jgi:hypothetical protein
MNAPLLLAGILLVGLVYVLVPVTGDAYVRFRRRRRVHCPEAGTGADVQLDARHAALTAAFGDPAVRVAGCSLWPERGGCAQACVPTADTAPHVG